MPTGPVLGVVGIFSNDPARSPVGVSLSGARTAATSPASISIPAPSPQLSSHDSEQRPQSGRRRRKPHVRDAQQWGVGWRSSTDEAVEQSHGTSARGSGEDGGKSANQGDRPAGTRVDGTAGSSRATGSEGRAES